MKALEAAVAFGGDPHIRREAFDERPSARRDGFSHSSDPCNCGVGLERAQGEGRSRVDRSVVPGFEKRLFETVQGRIRFITREESPTQKTGAPAAPQGVERHVGIAQVVRRHREERSSTPRFERHPGDVALLVSVDDRETGYHADVPASGPWIGRLAFACLGALAPLGLEAQQAPFSRLTPTQFDVTAPSARISGSPGTVVPRQTMCRVVPSAGIRRRIVDLAVQEWAYFGFAIVDRTRLAEVEQDDAPPPTARRRPRLPVEEASRLAPSIAGYWTATPSAGWVLARQNEEWNGVDGVGARWRHPWSAAFISWVMCEGGLGAPAQFQRAAAHHTYIDQAIRARSDRDGRAAYVAWDIGEANVEPGDLVCSARRPAYLNLAAREARMGEGARTHCDIVVRVDAVGEQLFAIGGNVGGRVSLKVLPARRLPDGVRARAIPLGRRGMSAFIHLKLRAPSVGPFAMDDSPTVRALQCGQAVRSAPLAAWLDALPRATACVQ